MSDPLPRCVAATWGSALVPAGPIVSAAVLLQRIVEALSTASAAARPVSDRCVGAPAPSGAGLFGRGQAIATSTLMASGAVFHCGISFESRSAPFIFVS